MKGTTHLILGAAAGVSAWKLGLARPADISWIALLLGSIAPDIDEERSKGARPASLLHSLLAPRVVGTINFTTTSVSRLIRIFFAHRGPTHWPLIGAGIVLAAMHFHNQWWLWFGIGYLSHIIGDMCTAGGVPLFGPFSARRTTILPIRVGGACEQLIAIGCAAYVAYGLKRMIV